MIELWEILVPTKRNNGRPYRTRHHREWDKQVYKITGGLTIMRPSIGKWVNSSNRLFEDRMIPVRIACTPDQLAEIMRRTFNHYPDQEAIMAYKISTNVVIQNRYGMVVNVV